MGLFFNLSNCYVQGTDGEPGEKGDDGESGQPVSWSFSTTIHPSTHHIMCLIHSLVVFLLLP